MKLLSKLFIKRDFSLLMIGKLTSLIGTEMQGFALSLYVLKITGSAAKFASVMAIALVPKLILAPLAGVLADWLNRKKLLIYLDILSGVTVAVFAMVFKYYGALSMVHIYILAIVLAVVGIFYNPAISVVIPSIVEKKDLAKAASINSFIMNMGSFLSPLIAGTLLAFYNIFIIMIFNSISFIVSAVVEILMTIPKTNKKPKKMGFKAFLTDFKEGLVFIKETKVLFYLIIVALIANFIFTPSLSLGVTYVSKQVLKVTDYQYGMLESAVVIAMILSSIISAVVCSKIRLMKIIFLEIVSLSILFWIWALFCSPVYTGLFRSNLIPFISLILVVCVVMLIVSVGNIAIGVMFQKIVPLEIMGRANTVMGYGVMAATPVAYILYGYLFDRFPAWVCLTISGGLLLITIMSFKKIMLGLEISEEVSIKNEDTDSDFVPILDEEVLINASEMNGLISQDNNYEA